ncbi:uncharacterized protein LOC144019348 [Festucalex cinctus]
MDGWTFERGRNVDGMEFPVDYLANVSQAELEASAHIYMNNLLYDNADCAEQLILSDSTKVSVDISRVGYVPLYGSSDKVRMLALFSPSDPLTAVALYLLGQWWTVDNILRTSDPTRDGIIKVTTIGERIVLYVLNRVIYRVREMNSEGEFPFLCHGEKDYAKICWRNGEAVGFYSVKPTGSLYNYFSTKTYHLPVMDSIFVRKCHRGDGFGLQMLEDFVRVSFQHDCVGLRSPLTKAMYKLCEKYLCQYPQDTDLLWEVEGVGGPNQRFNIAKRAQTTDWRDTGDIPVATRSRSSGRKKAKKADMIAESKSKKVIRVEDIEAETPEEHSSRNKRTASFSDLVVTTEGIFSSITEEKANDDVGIAVEESVDVNTTLTPHEAEDAAALAAEENQGGEALMDTSCDPHMRIENVSDIKGIEEQSREDGTSVDELHMMIDETFEGKDHSLSEGCDSDDKSTVLPLRGRSKVALEEINKYGKVKPDKTVNEREAEGPAEEPSSMGKGGAPEAEEEVKSLPEVNLEERKEVQEDENTKGMRAALTVAGDNGENANNLTLELDTATVVLEKHKPGEDQSVPAETESSQAESTELPKLQKSTVILVDLKTTHHQLSLMEVEKTEAPVECAESQKEATVLGPTGEKDASSSDGKEPKPEKPETVSQENSSEESISKVCETAETEIVKDGFAEKQNKEAVDKMKEVSVIQTRVLRSGGKKAKPSCKSRCRTKNQKAEDNRDIPVKEFNEAHVIVMEEDPETVTKNTDQSKQTSISDTSVNRRKDIIVMVTSDHVVPAKNPVPPLGEQTEPTAAQHQSAEMVSQLLDQKTVNVVLVDQSVQKQTSDKNGDKNEEKTNTETMAEKNVTRTLACVDNEQVNLVMRCTKETEDQVIGHKGKPEDTNEFIRDNQEIYDQDGGLEETAVDLQMETTELKTDFKKETVIEDCVAQQEEAQQGQTATEPKVATRDTADSLNDPAPQESMKTQGTIEEHDQTRCVFSNIESGGSGRETHVEELTSIVDQSSVEKRADLDQPEAERVLTKGTKSVPATTQRKPKRTCRLHQSEGEMEESATREEMQVEQMGQLLKEAEDKCENGGTTERDEEGAATRREEYPESNIAMKEEEWTAHPQTQEEGRTSIAKIDKRTTVSEAETVADPAKETVSLRKRKSTLTTLPRSKRPRSNRQKGKNKL